jgi:aryl-alcohol dehydrogenase-like predicted oxidoreductase
LYERDCQRAEQLQERLCSDRPLPQVALQFALAHPHIHAAIVGFGDASQIDDAIEAASTPLSVAEIERITAAAKNLLGA